MKLYAVKKEITICPICGNTHEVQTLRMVCPASDPNGEEYYQDWVYCGKSTIMLRNEELPKGFGCDQNLPEPEKAPEPEPLSEAFAGTDPEDADFAFLDNGYEFGDSESGWDFDYDGFIASIADESANNPFSTPSGKRKKKQPVILVTVDRFKDESASRKIILFKDYGEAHDWLINKGFRHDDETLHPLQARHEGWEGDWAYCNNSQRSASFASVKFAVLSIGRPLSITEGFAGF